jgi:hypothetical protein
MRISEFWRRMDARFGVRYAGSVASDLAISSLGSRTVNESLAAGVPPKRVWEAVCEAVEVPVAERH